MSARTPSGIVASVISLRAHLAEIRATDQEALRVARQSIDHRLEQMNELRDQISQERGDYLRVEDYDRRHEALIVRISALETWQANLAGRMVIFSVLAALFVGTVAALITHLVSG